MNKKAIIVGALAVVGALTTLQAVSTPGTAQETKQCPGMAMASGQNSCGDKAAKPVAMRATTADVSIDRAIQVARQNGNGFIRQAELKNKDGKTMWNLEMVNRDGSTTEMMVCGKTAKVAKMETAAAETRL